MPRAPNSRGESVPNAPRPFPTSPPPSGSARSTGPAHHDVMRLSNPAVAIVASPIAASLTAIQRDLVMLWVHAGRKVFASSSRVISGAPQKIPMRAGARYKTPMHRLNRNPSRVPLASSLMKVEAALPHPSCPRHPTRPLDLYRSEASSFRLRSGPLARSRAQPERSACNPSAPVGARNASRVRKFPKQRSSHFLLNGPGTCGVAGLPPLVVSGGGPAVPVRVQEQRLDALLGKPGCPRFAEPLLELPAKRPVRRERRIGQRL